MRWAKQGGEPGLAQPALAEPHPRPGHALDVREVRRALLQDLADLGGGHALAAAQHGVGRDQRRQPRDVPAARRNHAAAPAASPGAAAAAPPRPAARAPPGAPPPRSRRSVPPSRRAAPRRCPRRRRPRRRRTPWSPGCADRTGTQPPASAAYRCSQPASTPSWIAGTRPKPRQTASASTVGLASGDRAPVGVEPDRHHALDLGACRARARSSGPPTAAAASSTATTRAAVHLRQVGARAARPRRAGRAARPRPTRRRRAVSSPAAAPGDRERPWRGPRRRRGRGAARSASQTASVRARRARESARTRTTPSAGAGAVLVVHVDGGAGPRQLGGGGHPGGARAHHRRLDDDGRHQ